MNDVFVFSEMISDESMVRKDSAIKCLEVLSTSRANHWKSILDAGEWKQVIFISDLNNISHLFYCQKKKVKM